MNTRRVAGTRNDRHHHEPAESELAGEVVHLLHTVGEGAVGFPAEDQSEEGHFHLEGVTFPVDLGMSAIGEHLHISEEHRSPTEGSSCRSSAALDKRSERNRLHS